MKKNKKHTTSFELDVSSVQPLTDERYGRHAAIDARAESSIVCTESPPM